LQRRVQWTFEHEDVAMSTMKKVADKKPTTVVADDPGDLKGTLKRIGGSQSDHWNIVSTPKYERRGAGRRRQATIRVATPCA
jgi:hypothetical protein